MEPRAQTCPALVGSSALLSRSPFVAEVDVPSACAESYLYTQLPESSAVSALPGSSALPSRSLLELDVDVPRACAESYTSEQLPGSSALPVLHRSRPEPNLQEASPHIYSHHMELRAQACPALVGSSALPSQSPFVVDVIISHHMELRALACPTPAGCSALPSRSLFVDDVDDPRACAESYSYLQLPKSSAAPALPGSSAFVVAACTAHASAAESYTHDHTVGSSALLSRSAFVDERAESLSHEHSLGCSASPVLHESESEFWGGIPTCTSLSGGSVPSDPNFVRLREASQHASGQPSSACPQILTSRARATDKGYTQA